MIVLKAIWVWGAIATLVWLVYVGRKPGARARLFARPLHFVFAGVSVVAWPLFWGIQIVQARGAHRRAQRLGKYKGCWR